MLVGFLQHHFHWLYETLCILQNLQSHSVRTWNCKQLIVRDRYCEMDKDGTRVVEPRVTSWETGAWVCYLVSLLVNICMLWLLLPPSVMLWLRLRLTRFIFWWKCTYTALYVVVFAFLSVYFFVLLLISSDTSFCYDLCFCLHPCLFLKWNFETQLCSSHLLP